MERNVLVNIIATHLGSNSKDKESQSWRDKIEKTANEIMELCDTSVIKEDKTWTELSDKFREIAHRYKDGQIDYRFVWAWFQRQQENFNLQKINQKHEHKN